MVVKDRFIKPHGVLLGDDRLVVWGNAEDWKLLFLALYERAWSIANSKQFGVVLFNATGRFDETGIREMIESAASRLGIAHVVWLNT